MRPTSAEHDVYLISEFSSFATTFDTLEGGGRDRIGALLESRVVKKAFREKSPEYLTFISSDGRYFTTGLCSTARITGNR